MKRKPKQWYRYVLADERGKVYISTNDLYYAMSQGKSSNLEVRQILPTIRIGKRRIENRFKVLRRVTTQLDLI